LASACIEIGGPSPEYPEKGTPNRSHTGGDMKLTARQHAGQRRLCRVTAAAHETQIDGRTRSAA
jgi:hypothetical protein